MVKMYTCTTMRRGNRDSSDSGNVDRRTTSVANTYLRANSVAVFCHQAIADAYLRGQRPESPCLVDWDECTTCGIASLSTCSAQTRLLISSGYQSGWETALLH